MRLEDVKPGSKISGLDTQNPVEIMAVSRCSPNSINIVYRLPVGDFKNIILFRDDESRLSLAAGGQNWSLEADAGLLRLVTEAERIRLAYLFDPYLAIHTSLIDPLPHQISAVYGAMLPRQPLRFLLADDPGAGKTIMAGLLIKELIARSDVERCLVVAPGNLVEQWQDELGEKFGLEFDIFNPNMIENSRSGNPFVDHNHVIARLDVLARNQEIQQKLQLAPEWDLIICDEAHRMSATVFGNDVKYTKRYQLGQKLGQICRHFLLMSATPHNGKEADFQLFMALLDGDRFEGRFRDGVHYADTADMMRRLTKEELLKFDGSPLFPERRSYTVKYQLSSEEAALYSAVTDYVRTEMNRVLRFAEHDKQKRNNVGFALQILQRRLASSPAAIYQSLKRRRDRLENQLNEAMLCSRSKQVGSDELVSDDDVDDEQTLYKILDELPQDDLDQLEETISTGATASETVEQLKIELKTLHNLENQALGVLNSGKDTKWQQLNRILDEKLMRDDNGTLRKLIIFTESKDTLRYLHTKIENRLGRREAVDVIHGGVSREERRKVIERFMQDKDLIVLIANDAAGEGVNLQRGHLMVNYDLPWNPNKIEQRFGRIHRIGQTEVCHLWNLVAADTREGEVYARLLEKLEAAREALGGRVYDVLGELFDNVPLKDLLFEAIQYGERKDVREKLFEKIDGAVDTKRLVDLLKRRALTNETLTDAQVKELRLEMERAEAVRLQPHHIQSFFMHAFSCLGGRIREREQPGRFEVTYVPADIRERDRQLGTGAIVQKKYECICFDRSKINQQPVAEYICPGHPLLEATISLIRERYSFLLKEGAVLIDSSDESENIRAVFMLEHSVIDGCTTCNGQPHVISRKLQFTTIDENNCAFDAGIAPHLNFRPPTQQEKALIAPFLKAEWLKKDFEAIAMSFATEELAKKHVEQVRARRVPELEKIQREVRQRLLKEINYWENRANELREEERAGKKNRINWQNAERRAQDLEERLKKRENEIEKERNIFSQSPNIIGGMVVVPQGLLNIINQHQNAHSISGFSEDADARKEIELAAMNEVMAAEKKLGNQPIDVSAKKCGYDIESYDTKTGHLRFIEVKGRVDSADFVMITRQEIITSLNESEKFILAIVTVANGFACQPQYVKGKLSDAEPRFDQNAIQFNLKKLLANATTPQ